MIDLIKTIIVKIIPANWYAAKKTCDVITKLCDTAVELRWFVFPTLIIMAVALSVCFVYLCKLKIIKLRSKL
jgi:hypothetical protein